ncbi:thioredoxin-dependent thiol peroxidase [Hyalangium rubrum]|uniref:thioredoxin-dependent peroxiredoxin n=1 Tax=Hyalangium rubrum TaxID=3103134 RepID=A0ABU5H3D6_9BACT|nr:thioredoxin-dependent thiol peroxidase [Hyalangium sp. s54d21]MDY7227619.1 thioredoxin-dependent thiol peroxidase [Hyalangium sp. s54d21]
MPLPQVGSQAPAFQLSDQTGKTVSLSQFAGKHVVLYFYPKDNTSGCTKEACDFRDEHSALEKAGAVVVGVSPDSVKSHEKFVAKYSLPFTLLADPEHKLADAYGVWGEKSLYGRKFMGITRTTVLIDPQGRVKQVWPKVKVTGHVGEVLSALSGGDAAEPSAEPKKKASAAKVAKKVGAAVKSAVKKVAKKSPSR